MPWHESIITRLFANSMLISWLTVQYFAVHNWKHTFSYWFTEGLDDGSNALAESMVRFTIDKTLCDKIQSQLRCFSLKSILSKWHQMSPLKLAEVMTSWHDLPKSHHLNQCCVIRNWAHQYYFKDILKRITNIFIQGTMFENVVCMVTTTLRQEIFS